MTMTETWVLSAPLLLPFATAVAALLVPRPELNARWVSLGGSALHLVATVALATMIWQQGPMAASFGGWQAPLGIALVADTLSAVMVLVTALMGLVCATYAIADVGKRRARRHWHALYQVLLAGATGAFLTGDLFNLYVWFEVMLIASFGLLVMGGSRAELDGGVKYVALNLVATIMFLTAIGLIHAITGTLTMADLPARLIGADPAAVAGASMLLFGAFAAKAGLFPLFFWLPAAYHTPPMAVTAIFAGILTKAGVYALMRVFTLVFPEGPAMDVLLVIAVLTMVVGVIGAAAQTDVHRILSFHIVSQIGYMALGIALGSALALLGAILYMVHNIVVKANLFLIAGVGRRLTGSHRLGRGAGLYAAAPFLTVLFLLAAMAMAGVPPFSGFWGKLALVQAGAAEEHWLAIAATLGVGLFTLYSMTKIWLRGYLAEPERGRARHLTALPGPARVALLTPIVALTAVSLSMGLAPEPYLAVAERAAAELLAPQPYIDAVLGLPPTFAEGGPR
ncbi:MAG: proton-conducting transporter membrane subunit [Pseudomonadota bacterium]